MTARDLATSSSRTLAASSALSSPSSRSAAASGRAVPSALAGRYRSLFVIGRGGMGTVEAALEVHRDHEVGETPEAHDYDRVVALKRLLPDARDARRVEMFLREARLAAMLDHPNVVRAFDYGETDGELFLAMEYVEGQALSRVLRALSEAKVELGVSLTAHVLAEVCEGLHAAHELRDEKGQALSLVHRDVSPQNVMLAYDGHVRLLDFGVAKIEAESVTKTGEVKGKSAYMSPEQAMGLVDQLDGRADLFSVGAMMHALITGHRINNGRTEQEALVMAATKPVPSVARLAPHLPIELIKTIDKALAWDRRNRFQDAREMQRGLIDMMPSQNVGALEARPPPRPLEVVAELAPAPAPPPNPSNPSNAGLVTGAGAAVQAAAAPAPAPPAAKPQPNKRPSVRPSAFAAPTQGSVAQPLPKPAAYDPLVGYQPPGTQAPAQRPLSIAPPQAAVALDLPDADPRVQALRDVMKHFDRVLPSVRQFGWAHPATDRTLRTAYDAIAEALRQHPTLIAWTLRPYSFMTLGQTVWEPGPPFDAIPYNLFACGMRTLDIKPGVTIEELRELFALFLVDPGRDLPPEDDLAAAFWEKALSHVKYEVVDAFAEGDAAEREAFYGEADKIEDLAQDAAHNQMNRIEAKAMALSTDAGALGKTKDPSPFALDEVMRGTLRPQFEIPREVWSERYVDALVEGYLDSAANRDAPLVLASLRKSAGDLAVAGRIGVAVQLSQAVIERLRQRVQGAENQGKLAGALTNAMFGGETLEIVLRRMRTDPSLLDSFGVVLSGLGPNEFPTVLANLREATQPHVRTALVSFVERTMAGRELEIAAAVPGSDPDAVAALIQLLGRSSTPGARQAITQLVQSEDVNVRVEARVLAAPSPEHAQQELSSLLDNASAFVRMAALRAVTRYQMRNAWVTVARIINGKTFNDLGNDERRELLRAAILLSPERGEPLALELAKKGGVLLSENREATRALAAELLGDHSKSRQTGAALHELAQTRWGLSDETRNAAANAAKRIGQRLAGSPQGGASA